MISFATEERPLRASRIPSLLVCSMSEISLLRPDGESSVAADTGSAVHKAIALWHRDAKGDAAVALGAMKAFREEYPAADLRVAAQHFHGYIQDERNQGLETPLIEEKVTVRLPPSPQDPTGQDIVIIGHLDQVRVVSSGFMLVDYKTGGSLTGVQMVNAHMAQMAVYAVGAEQLGFSCNSIAIVRTLDYLKGGPVFWHLPFGVHGAKQILREVADTVADIRRGRIRITPHRDCSWCQHGSPVNCQRLRAEFLQLAKE